MRSIKEVHEYLQTHSPEDLINKYKKLCSESKHNTYITLNNDIQYNPLLKDKKLFCVPISIKDAICIEGMRTTCASKMLENFVPNYTATVVKKLLNEGAIIVGKANMDEFAMGSSSTTGYFGPVINPRSTNKKLIAGGSSGGSAASVAEGSCIVSLGTDTGGSVRHPAALCGVVGIRPTYGRCSRYGVIALASSLDQVGVVANNVEDAARILDVISGPDINDPTTHEMHYELDLESYCGQSVAGKKIGIITDLLFDQLSIESITSFNSAIDAFKKAGCSIHEFSIPEIIQYSLECYYIQNCSEVASNLARYDGLKFGYHADGNTIEDVYKNTRTEGFGDEVKRRILTGNYILSRDNFSKLYLNAQQTVEHMKQKINAIFQEVDVILTPIVLGPAFPIDEMPDPISIYKQDLFTAFVNILSLAGITIPVGNLAVQIVCNSFQEEKLIAFGYELESHFSKKVNKTVIGLEVHAQLNTQEKLFSKSSTKYSTNPNENVSNFDLAIPGTLPVLNREAVYKAIQLGIALHSKINLISRFDRKHYFYPDLPAGYQITQFYQPILSGGYLQLFSGEKIRIHHVHIEQDAGKIIHEDGKTLLDFNRAGIPLVEIVTEPDLSPETTVDFLRTLRNLLVYLDISDGRFEEGSIRADINISVRNHDNSLGTRVEIKNINSYNHVQQAITYEVQRHNDLIARGEKITRETRLFHESGITKSMRSKESSEDYKYFPEPDLPPLKITEKEIQQIRANMPELPYNRYIRYLSISISHDNAIILVSEKEVADYFDQVVGHHTSIAILASNWIVTEWLGQRKLYDHSHKIPADQLHKLILYIHENAISQLNAKKAMKDLWHGIETDQAVKDMLQINDKDTILQYIYKLDQEKLLSYKQGNMKIEKFLIGQVMSMSNGRANPIIVKSLLENIQNI